MALQFFDIETRSYCDLRKTGGKVYAEDPSTEILCAVWIEKGSLETHVWTPLIRKEPARFLEAAWLPEGFPGDVTFHWGPEFPRVGLERDTWVANNGDDFDFHVWEALGLPMPAATMDSIRYFRRASIPGGLDAACKVVLGDGKHEGRVSMLRLSKPSKRGGFLPVSAANMPPVVAYCIDDVDKMRRVWEEYLEPRRVIEDRDDPCLEVDRRINALGIRIDLKAAERIAEVEEHLKVYQAEQLAEETEGKADRGTLRSPKQFLEFVEDVAGLRLPNCRRKTLEKVRDSANCDPVVKKAIEARIGENRVTGRKMVRAIMASPKDGRVRGALAYASAQTWRWGGRKIQPQNLPSPKIGPAALEKLHAIFDDPKATLEQLVEAVLSHGGNAGDVLGSLTRGVVIPAVGSMFLIADWSAIEARGLMWLVDDKARLEMFRSGKDDPYKVFATDLFGVEYADVTDRQRKVCKPAVLGAGYQIGGDKMEAYAQLMGVRLEDFGTSGPELVNQWRDLNPRVAGENTGEEYEGHPIRRGGAWKDLQATAELVVRDRIPRECCRCLFEFQNGDVVVTLPSGSRRRYPNARMEDVVPSWGGPARPQFTYDKTFGGRVLAANQYGGKWVENCLTGDTLVLTPRGYVRLEEVQLHDKVFDGVEWVNHSGLSYRGERETGRWHGVRLTGDHLILVGNMWRPAIHMDGRSSLVALRTAQGLIESSSSRAGVARGPRPGFGATAAGSSRPKPGSYGAGGMLSALGVPGPERPGAMTTCSETARIFSPLGHTDIREWYPVATILNTGLTRTTGAVGSRFTARGSKTERSSSGMPKLSPVGIKGALTLTGSTTTGTIGRGISAWSPGKSTPETGVAPVGSLDRSFPPQGSMKHSLPDGPAQPSTTTWGSGEPQGKSWEPTGLTESVFDLLNAGPRSRFTILTDDGPAIVHNCVQAICRDILADALVALTDAGFTIPLHVHDEIVAEETLDRLEEMCQIMTRSPKWAPDFPLGAEGFIAPRYLKKPFPGAKKVKARTQDGLESDSGGMEGRSEPSGNPRHDGTYGGGGQREGCGTPAGG